MEFNIGEVIVDEEVNIGDLQLDAVKERPELEDLEVTPSGKEQNFKSKKYGYNNIKVKAVESEELNIIPSTEEQIKEGLYNKVTVAGSENLTPNNIKKGIDIFGVSGIAETGNAEMLSKISEDISYRDIRTFLVKINTIIDVSNTPSIANYFQNCRNLTEIPLGNTSHIANMSYLFHRCASLIEVPEIDTSNVINMQSIFSDCPSLITIPSINTEKVNNMSGAFQYCSGLEIIPELNAQSVTQISNIVSGCRNLEKFGGLTDLGKAYKQKTANYSYYKLDLSSCSKLMYESLMNVINSLYDLNLTYDVANGGTLYSQSLVLGSTNRTKLTEEEIAIATSKGWNVT